MDGYELQDQGLSCIYCCCETEDLNDCVCFYNKLCDLYDDDGNLTVDTESYNFDYERLSMMQEQGSGDADNATPNLREKTVNKTKKYVHSETYSNVFDCNPTNSSEQAIDFLVQDVGANCNRAVSKLRTPSGIKDCIHMTNEGTLSSKRHDYLASVAMPEIGFVWGTNKFSKRTKHIMTLFEYFNTMFLFKIIAKPALFSSQRVWVGLGDAANQTDVGFEWNPSEQNEVYCVAPWVKPSFVEDVKNVDLCYPTITITPLTDPIFAEGVSSTIEYTTFIAPLNMFMYNPLTTPDTDPTPDPADDDFIVDVVSAPFTSPQPPFLFFPRKVSVTNDFLGSASASVGGQEFFTANTITGFYSAKPIVVTTDDPISQTNCIVNDAYFIEYNDQNLLPTITSETPIEVSTGTNPISTLRNRIHEIEVDDFTRVSPFTFTIDTNNNFTYEFLLPLITGYDTDTSTTTTSTATLTPYLIDSTPLMEEQISEYKYNDNFTVDSRVYGKTGNHTSRCDTHWDAQPSIYFNTTNDVKYVTNTKKGTAALDSARHYFQSKHPVIKLTSTSVPSSNVLLRVTQIKPGTTPTLEEVLELPGVEWDPKTGPLIMQPYWRSKHPLRGTTGLSDFLFQLDVLGGTISTEPLVVTPFVNYTCVNYHMPFLKASSVVRLPTFNEQMESDKKSVTENHQDHSETTTSNAVSSSITGNVKVSNPTVVVEEDSLKQYSPGDISQTWRQILKFQITSLQTAIAFAITNQAFGAPAFQESQRYSFWRGNPTFKFVVSAPRNYNGLFYSTSFPASMDINSVKSTQILHDREVSTFTAIDGSLEITPQWGTTMPRLKNIFDVNNNVNNQDTVMGYLILFADQLANNATINVSVFCDSSDVEFILEAGRDIDAEWTPPALITPPAFQYETSLSPDDEDRAREILLNMDLSKIQGRTVADVMKQVHQRLSLGEPSSVVPPPGDRSKVDSLIPIPSVIPVPGVPAIPAVPIPDIKITKVGRKPKKPRRQRLRLPAVSEINSEDTDEEGDADPAVSGDNPKIVFAPVAAAHLTHHTPQNLSWTHTGSLDARHYDT